MRKVLLNSVIIVLREILEAALVLSLLLAFSSLLGLRKNWVLPALAAGVLGAALYGFNISRVSVWLDYVGQEVVNACLQFGIYMLLLVMPILVTRYRRDGKHAPLVGVMALVFVLALTREGSEILIYLSGFASVPEQILPVFLGGVLGAGIGISTGALFYYVLTGMRPTVALGVGLGLTAVVGASMASQAALLLSQADWLPSTPALWDSSAWLAEDSLTGQLLYALIGYEATPSSVQVGFYALGLCSIGLDILLCQCLQPDGA